MINIKDKRRAIAIDSTGIKIISNCYKHFNDSKSENLV